MLVNLKALVVVLCIAAAAFIVAKPVCLRFMAEDDFVRRRNVWFALTIAGFISPTFWIFLILAAPILFWSGHKDANPVALYVLLMHVIPRGVDWNIPVVGINALFELNGYRILALTVLFPTALRLLRSGNEKNARARKLMDALMLAYLAVQLVLLMPYESTTNTMRRGFLFAADVLVLYFVVSRICVSRRAILETMASLCLACAILAPLAVFEMFSGWLLYQGIGDRWGSPIEFAYIVREGLLRAQVSAGHALVLGNMMALAFGFWLYLRSQVRSSLSAVVIIAMWGGLIAAYSRGPWLVAVVIFFASFALIPNGLARFSKILLIAALVAGLVLVSPIGGRVIDNLPFVGTVEEGGVTYRQELLMLSLDLIQRNPIFGNPFFLTQMESLRQGQGIVDLLNTHTTVAMSYGLLGYVCFIGPFLIGMRNAYRLVRNSASSDADLAMLGTTLIASTIGLLLIMSFGGYEERLAYLVLGLTAGYLQLQPLQETAPTQPSPGLVPESRVALKRR